MERGCSFETNIPELARLWQCGLDLYDAVTQRELRDVCTQALDFPLLFSATLLLEGDGNRAQQLLDCAGGLFEQYAATGERVQCVLTFATALESYLLYTGDTAFAGRWIPRAEEMVHRVFSSALVPDPVTEALFVGAKMTILHIRALCGAAMARVELADITREFHHRFFDESTGLYCINGEPSPILCAIVAAFGYVSDDGHDTVREYLLTHAFEIPRAMHGFLFRALVNLEADDALFPCVVEGGVPVAGEGASSLASLVVMIRDLCGIDLSMLGRGIYCMHPRLPDYVAFRLILPSQSEYMLFDMGELPNAFRD